MSGIKNIYLIGLGAIGGAYGSQFIEKGITGFRVIADRERITRYQEEGVYVNGKKCDFSYGAPDDGLPSGDLILVACKFHHLGSAMDSMKNFIGPGTVIVSLLNGITSEEVIGSRFGMDKMLYAVCLGIDAVRNGNDIRYSSLGKIIFGERFNRETSPRVRAIRDLLNGAGIPNEVPEDAMKALWKKFMINAGINQPSAIMGANYGVFQNDENARGVMIDIMKEVIVLSEKAGIGLSQSDIDLFLNILAGLAPEGKTSMLQDMEAGRKTEVEMLAGVIVELGGKYAVPVPLNNMMLMMIKAMESMRGIDSFS